VGSLPLGVQVIGPAYREEWVLRVAERLQQMGIACAHPPVLERVV
jgi:Asp-tRNA(Asn)/Glu-tRNA(Gln) amidotransferase A subunit family amidase